jgi:3-hydroxymyristoyl/3-hydroxydecanoyl-(acyl carrier protein) dehydratase
MSAFPHPAGQGGAMALVRDYPFDRIVEQTGDLLCVERFVACADPIFNEHFPERPVLPGSYVLGTAVAAAGVLWGVAGYRAGIMRTVFLRPAGPGDSLHVTVRRMARADEAHGTATFRFSAVQRLDARPVAEGVLLLTQDMGEGA